MSNLAYDSDTWDAAITGDATSWTSEENERRNSMATQPARRAGATSWRESWGDFHSALQRKIYPLVRLESGWDTYDGQPVQFETATFVVRLLTDLVDDRTPFPSIVPTASGGLQVEWHIHDIDLEILVEEPYEAEFYFFDHRTGRVDEAGFRSDFQALNEPIELLNSRG